MKDLLRTLDLSRQDFKYLLSRASKFKAHPHSRHKLLFGDSICMYFAKPSTRTRISFEAAIARLGGNPLALNPADLQLGRGETLEDTARIISRYARALVIRTFKDEDVHRLAKAATIPIVNALTDGHHPCQSVADMLTIQEHRGSLKNCKIAYFGDGNNVAISLMEASALVGADFVIACPEGYSIPEPLIEQARAVADETGGTIRVTRDPEEAARGADALYTDVWLSMGDADSEREARFNALSPYQVNERLSKLAAPGAIFLHCLPAHRGEEVTADVIDGPSSMVWDQAENRMHTSMAILYGLLEGKIEGRQSERR
ncbi:MAG TPA: ornithine carbamoyltransferase [Polyangiaceae bacterium]|nr:ornithine carbamoyltransferase [Polyangiaceae bacterium]